MTVIAYQVFIIFTILIVKILFKKYLVAICLAWTAFTFLSVFHSPLMLLQLLNIWSCYALLNNREKKTDIACSHKLSETKGSGSNTISAPKQLAPLHFNQPAPTVTQGTVIQGVANGHRTIGGVLGGAASFISEVGDYVSLASAVQETISELNAAIVAERILIESALSRSKNEIEVQKWREKNGPEAWSHYQQAHAQFTQVLKGDIGQSIPASQVTPPNFYLPRKHAEPKITEAIERKILSIKDERDSFISGVVKELWADDQLREIFVTKLHDLGGSEIWSGIFAFARRQLEGAQNLGAVVNKAKEEQVPRHLRDKELFIKSLILDKAEERAIANLAVKKCGGGSYYKDRLFEQGEKVELPYFLHFTRAENLPSIMQHGLCPVAMLNDRAIHYYRNDSLRLDGHLDATSISIAHPNDKMFARYRWENPEQDWVVLVLDRSILWTTEAAFCKHNAADNRIRQHPIANFITVPAFDSMFLSSDELPSREESCLLPFDPTDVQAEVLVFGTLKPELINCVVFSDGNTLEKYKRYLGQRRVAIHAIGQGFFGARSYARKSGWAP